MQAPVSTVSEQIEPMSQPARIVSVFSSPGKAFQGLNRDASWWMAWLLLSVFSLALVFTMDHKIGFEQITQNELAKNARMAERMENMPADKREQMIVQGARFSKGIAYGAPILGLVGYCIIAAVLMGTFNFGLAAQVSFKQSLAVVIYGLLPGIVSSVVGVLGISLSPDPSALNMRNPVASNPAYFMDQHAHPFVYGMASGLDVFSIWMIVLMGIGFAANSKVKRSTAITVVAGWYLLVKLIGAGWAAMFA